MPDRLLHFLEGVSSEYKREIEPFSQSTASVSHWLLRESLAIGCHPENPPTKSLCDVIKKTLKSRNKKKKNSKELRRAEPQFSKASMQ